MKPNLLVEFHQAVCLRRHGRFDSQPDQLAARISSARSPAGSAAARSKKRWCGRHRPDSSEEALLEASGQWLRRAHAEPARELGRRESARELEQCQPVAARLSQDPLYHPLIDTAGDRDAEDSASVFVSQAAQNELAQSGERFLWLGSRTANTRATDSAMSRRATNASVRAEA